MVAYYWQLLNYFYILGNFFSEFKKNQQKKENINKQRTSYSLRCYHEVCFCTGNICVYNKQQSSQFLTF